MLRACIRVTSVLFNFPSVDSGLGDLEKKACQVLCRLRNEGDEAKEVCSRMQPELSYIFNYTVLYNVSISYEVYVCVISYHLFS